MTVEFVQPAAGDARRTWVDALNRKYSRALWKFLARQSLSRGEVADIVQETYCRIQQSGNVEAIRNPKAFLFRVANNVRLNERKHHHSGIENETLDIQNLDVASDEPSPYRICNGEQEIEIVRAAFRAVMRWLGGQRWLSRPCALSRPRDFGSFKSYRRSFDWR